jgi:amino acid transporter
MSFGSSFLGVPAHDMIVAFGSSFLVLPPLLALVYCVFIWLRKTNMKCSWIGFFATTIAVLILIALPTLMAVFLPVIDFMNRQIAK